LAAASSACAAVILAGLLCAPDALAQRAASRLSMQAPDIPVNVEVYGPTSRDANPRVWPATFVFRNAVGAGCSATAIGEKVLLTAAHCLTDKATGTVETGLRRLDVLCEHHSAYPGNPAADFSLCIVTGVLSIPGGFETLNSTLGVPAKDDDIKLLGFGCRTEGGADRNFGRLAEGDATVLEINGDNIIVGGGSGTCFGDSGGGAYLLKNGVRRLVAVNSQSDVNSYSWLSSVGSLLFSDWARKWAAGHQVAICGLDANAKSCRP
jgi:hypothetical protein